MSYKDYFSLTFSQCKQLVSNGYDLPDFLEQVTTQQPEFIKSMGAIDSISELQAIQQGGCASGSYMPAVTYHTALQCMSEHHSEVEDLLSDYGPEFTFNPTEDSFATLASNIVAMAVEHWAGSFDLSGVDWD